jgi:hypothetical protein
MSARDDLLSFAQGNDPKTQDSFRVLADAYRAEVLREAADAIDRELPEKVKRDAGFWAEIRTVSTAQHAAELLRRMAEEAKRGSADPEATET